MLDDQDEFDDYRRRIAEQMVTQYDTDVDTMLRVMREIRPEDLPGPRLLTTEALTEWKRRLDALIFKRYGIKRRKKDGQRNVS